MDIDFEKIKKEWPKSYEKIITYYQKGSSRIDYCITNSLCFCDFVDFFDSVGIEVFILPFAFDKYEHFIWKNKRSVWVKNWSSTRPEAQVEAVYAAFKIMESIQ